MTVEVIDAPARLIKVTYECNLDDHVFRWKWSYLWQWRRCYYRWRWCRNMDKWAKREADRIREEIDKDILKLLTGETNVEHSEIDLRD